MPVSTCKLIDETTVLYAYQVIPGSSRELSYAATLRECRRNAKRLAAYLREHDDEQYGQGERTIFRVELRSIETWALLEVLNDSGLVADAFIHMTAVDKVLS